MAHARPDAAKKAARDGLDERMEAVGYEHPCDAHREARTHRHRDVTTLGSGCADAGTRTSVPLVQYMASDPDNPPKGVIIPITKELMQAQRASRPRDVEPEVKARCSARQCLTPPGRAT